MGTERVDGLREKYTLVEPTLHDILCAMYALLHRKRPMLATLTLRPVINWQY